MRQPAEPPATHGALSWPNAITLLRIPLAGALFLVEGTLARAAIIAVAGATDYVDGWLARRFRQGSRAGELLDPVLDKLFVLAAIVAFATQGLLEPWAIAVLLARDVVISIAFIISIAASFHIRFRARRSGKVVTGLQIASMLAVALAPALAWPVVLATGAATVWAITDYSSFALRSLREAGTAG